MGFDKSGNKDDILALIGHVVSSLLASGKTVKKEDLVSHLRNLEKKAVNGKKKLYGEAARMVESGWSVSSEKPAP